MVGVLVGDIVVVESRVGHSVRIEEVFLSHEDVVDHFDGLVGLAVFVVCGQQSVRLPVCRQRLV